MQSRGERRAREGRGGARARSCGVKSSGTGRRSAAPGGQASGKPPLLSELQRPPLLNRDNNPQLTIYFRWD